MKTTQEETDKRDWDEARFKEPIKSLINISAVFYHADHAREYAKKLGYTSIAGNKIYFTVSCENVLGMPFWCVLPIQPQQKDKGGGAGSSPD
jgi:hypothetical protein